MKRNQGITVIELLIIVGIFGILSAIILPSLDSKANDDGTICKSGYKFAGRDSRSSQILDSQGHGIPCNGKE